MLLNHTQEEQASSIVGPLTLQNTLRGHPVSLMAEVAPVPGSQPLIIDLNEPQAPMDERRFSTPARMEGPHTDAREDKVGAEGAFPNVRKTYWRSASWTPGRGGRPSLQRTVSGKAPGVQRANGKVLSENAGGGKGKGLRIQVGRTRRHLFILNREACTEACPFKTKYTVLPLINHVVTLIGYRLRAYGVLLCFLVLDVACLVHYEGA